MTLWDTRTWKVIRVIPVFEVVEAVGFLNNGDLLYTGGENGRLRIWNRHDGRELTQEQGARSESDAILQVLKNSTLDVLVSVHVDSSLVLHSTACLAALRLSDGAIPYRSSGGYQGHMMRSLIWLT